MSRIIAAKIPMPSLHVIELLAGHNAAGAPVVERLQVVVNDDNSCKLVKSPAFVKGIASGDIIKLNTESSQFEVKQRSGNLCIRVFSRGDIDALAGALTAELEKLGGQLDVETPRMLVYSIHVSCGFQAIETILGQHVRDGDSIWSYGNVYDPADGSTPLNWWLDILKPE